MKKFYSIYNLTTLCVVCVFGCVQATSAEGVRIRPRSVEVRSDSLHLHLTMDLNDVHVNTMTAVTFTPVLRGKKGNGEEVLLPPVIVTGSKREGFERRENALATDKPHPVIPYLILTDNRKTGSRNIPYRVSIPYASWMRTASLLLRQEIKDCCDLRLMGVDTLTRNLAVNKLPEKQQSPPKPVTTTAPVAQLAVVTVRPATAPLSVIKLSSSALATYCSMVSFLQPDPKMKIKQYTKSAILYIDYPLGKHEVYPDYKNNREEINKADCILQPLISEGFSELEQISVRGYASPDGNYGDNEKLAAARSGLFAHYVQQAYNIPSLLFRVSSVAEDWDGFIDLLLDNRPSYSEAVLDIIDRYGIFGGREKKLMDLQGGVPYKDMLKRFFPKLRRIEMVVEYRIRQVAAGEASQLIYTHPDLLSLDEMYEVARYYRPGTDQYREVYEIAAFHFPDDVVANVNAASAVMLTGDLKSAWEYLRKVEADPRAWNNMGVLTLMEGNPAGAAIWFRKAVGVEPHKARHNLEMAEGMAERE